MDSSTPELCADTIYEILSRSSFQTLARCRLLSHDINRLSYESTFMDLHSQRAKVISGYFMQSLISYKYSSSFLCPNKSGSYPKLPLHFLPNPVKILASTNQGILLCSDHDHRIPTYYLCKPTTKQWRSIPRPKTRYHTLATGVVMMKSDPLHYKIVRFSDPKYSNSNDFRHYHVVRCELFDSNTWKWKQLEVVKLPIRELFHVSSNVSAHASLHWLTSRNNIFAFDVNNESYSLFSPPQPVIEGEEKKKDMKLVEYEGKLALVCTGKEDNLIDLWVMEKYDKKEWSKRFTINIESLRRKERYTWPISFYNADIALMKEWDCRVSFFNCRNGRTESVLLEKSFNCGFFPFRSDFELCDQLVPKRPKDAQTKKQQLRTSNINHNEPALMQAEEIRIRHNCFVLSPESSFLVLLLVFIFFCFMLNL